jgi:hypothetical protein
MRRIIRRLCKTRRRHALRQLWFQQREALSRTPASRRKSLLRYMMAPLQQGRAMKQTF